MTKDEILSEIRRLGGRNKCRLSLAAFCKLTGIREKQMLGVHWPTWNAAITDAGLKPQSFARPRTDEGQVLEALAQLVERLGHWPTHTELRMERHRSASFPSLKVINRLNNASPKGRKLFDYCAQRPDLVVAMNVASQRVASEPIGETARVGGYVYMMRSGRRYKIGKTNSPSRRHREVRLDLPDPTTVVHSIATDDPAGIEAYWHKRFGAKRVRDTEFFALDQSDVAAFKSRKSQ